MAPVWSQGRTRLDGMGIPNPAEGLEANQEGLSGPEPGQRRFVTMLQATNPRGDGGSGGWLAQIDLLAHARAEALKERNLQKNGKNKPEKQERSRTDYEYPGGADQQRNPPKSMRPTFNMLTHGN